MVPINRHQNHWLQPIGVPGEGFQRCHTGSGYTKHVIRSGSLEYLAGLHQSRMLNFNFNE